MRALSAFGGTYDANVHLRVFERWLDEGWSPVRIGYGIVSLIITAVTVYLYARQAHHPGAIWWLMWAVVIVTVWAVSEMLRWRIKYRRLLIAQQVPTTPPPQPIRKLLTDGKELHADIANHASWWGTNRLLPSGVPGRIVRWESDVSEALVNQPEVRDLFQNVANLDVNRPVSGQACGRLEYELNVLESATKGGTEDLNAESDPSAVARVKSSLETYYAGRVRRLEEVYEEGCSLRAAIQGHKDADASPLVGFIDTWDNKVRDVLMYWPDLNRVGYLSTLHTPNIHDLDKRVGRELEALQTAMSRLRN